VKSVAQQVATEQAIKVSYEPTAEKKGLSLAEVEALYASLTNQAKAKIALYEQNSSSFPAFKVSLKKKIGLGETFKVVGNCPELGRMKPEAAPSMKWTDGDVWVWEGKVQPGQYKYKAALRTAYNAYVWEEGADRVLDLNDSTSVEISVKFP
jgi:hypothetical protein